MLIIVRLCKNNRFRPAWLIFARKGQDNNLLFKEFIEPISNESII